MQALILLLATAALASATQLTLLPYAYLADPLPVYHQSQDTRTGEHAYSYSGGPSAKEEVRGLDGVTRGSYSYVDAHGILQSVFYVADEGGFRVAATNLPADDDLAVETAQVLLSEHAHADVKSTSRRKRSLENAAVTSSQDPTEQKTKESTSDHGESASVQPVLYQLPSSVLVPKLLATATSHQSHVQIHKNVKLEGVQPVAKIAGEAVYQPVVLPAEVPLASAHQSQVQIQGDVRPEAVAIVKAEEPVDVVHAPVAPIKAYYQLETLPFVPNYHENRIHLHRDLGIEGPERKDTVKIKTEPAAIVHAPVATVPLIPAVETKTLLPVAQPVPELATATVTTSVSSHGISQIHGSSKVAVAAPVLSEPTLFVRNAPISHFQPIVSLPFFQALPYARASHYRTQVHAN